MVTVGPRPTTTKTCEDGFTLAEVLISLALLGTMASLMLAFAGQYGRIEANQKQIAARSELSTVLRHMKQMVSAARQLPLTYADATSSNSFLVGQTDRLIFTTLARTGSNSVGLRELSFEIANKPDGSSELIERQFVRRRFGRTATSVGKVYVLAEDVQSIAFRFLPSLAETEPKQEGWQHVWTAVGELPLAVEVEIVIERYDRQISGRARIGLWGEPVL